MIIGIDLSLNHAGLVQLDAGGRVVWWDWVTDVRAASDRGGRGVYLPRPKSEDKEQGSLERLVWWEKYISELFVERDPFYVGIEGYAFRAEGNAAYQIGELGGLVRLAALHVGAKLRCPDPMSVKMFGASRGNATGAEVADAVRAMTGGLFVAANPPQKAGKKQNALPEEDLSAAWVVAQMVWTELQLRAGSMRLDQLGEKQLQVFNRCTKSQPINLLARTWLCA